MRNRSRVTTVAGTPRKIYGAEMRKRIDRELHTRIVRATTALPGRACRATEDARRHRSPWNGLLNIVRDSFERASVLDAYQVEQVAERLYLIPDVLREYINDARDEALAELAREMGETPRRAA